MTVINEMLILRVQLWILNIVQGPGMEDPGMPGGGLDPDLPETPLDSGVLFLVMLALIYGVWQIRKSASLMER